jgi:hypothetical protein
MVRVPIAPQVEAQVPQGPSGAPQFQAPPMPGMQESQQLAQQFMRAGQAALDIERDEQALSLLQAKKQERAALKAQAERDAFNESRVKDLLQKTSIQADAIADTFLGSQMADAADYSGTLTSIREAFKATVDSLENEQQKELYGAKAETMLLAYDRDLRRHSARERKRYEVAQSMSEAEAFGNRAVRHAESIGEPTGDHTMFLLAGVQQLRDAYAKQGLPANDPVSQQKVQQFVTNVADKSSAFLMQQDRFSDVRDYVKQLESAELISAETADLLTARATDAEDQKGGLSVASRIMDTGEFGGTVPAESLRAIAQNEGLDVVGVGKADGGRTVLLAAPVDGEDVGTIASSLRSVGLNVHSAKIDGDMFRFEVSASERSTAKRTDTTSVNRLADGTIDIADAKRQIDASDRSDVFKETAKKELERLSDERAGSAAQIRAANINAATNIAHSNEAVALGRSQWHRIQKDLWDQLPADVKAKLQADPPRSDRSDIKDQLYTLTTDRSKTPEQKLQFLQQNRPNITQETFDRFQRAFSSEGTGEANEIRDRAVAYRAIMAANGYAIEDAGLNSMLQDEWNDAVNASNAGRASRSEKMLTMDQEKQVLLEIVEQRMARVEEPSIFEYVPGILAPSPRARIQAVGIGDPGITAQQYQQMPRIVLMTNSDGTVTQQEVPSSEYQMAVRRLRSEGIPASNENIGEAIRLMREEMGSRR